MNIMLVLRKETFGHYKVDPMGEKAELPDDGYTSFSVLFYRWHIMVIHNLLGGKSKKLNFQERRIWEEKFSQ